MMLTTVYVAAGQDGSVDACPSDQQGYDKEVEQAAPTTATGSEAFDINQTLSSQAQQNTIAFDALAFLTGNFGADTFLPPGKVADMWGFQYLRDNDPTKMGHNTDFLSKAANNVLYVLNDDQKAELIALAKAQVEEINNYAYDRFALIDAFCRLLSGDVPEGSEGLDLEAVLAYSATLYELDGQICLERAKVMGGILRSLSAEQRAYLDSMNGIGMLNWPDVNEQVDPRTMTHDEHVAVMTYAGDLLSWYLGSTEADIYFCPERQGTYFGSFYLKDAPAMGNSNYTIDEKLTGDSGSLFLDMLSAEQAAIITDLVSSQMPYLLGIVEVRGEVSAFLRGYIEGGVVEESDVLEAMSEYGELDGAIVYSYAEAFASINATLTSDQRASINALRAQLGVTVPSGAYLYSSPIEMPEVPDTDFLFSCNESAPDAPTAVIATPGNGKVELSWSAPIDDGGSGVEGYIIYQDGIEILRIDALSADITGLINGQSYSFSIAAENSLGTGPQTDPVIVTPATVPDAPGGVATAASTSKIVVSWSAPLWNGGSDVFAYDVYSATASTSYIRVASTSGSANSLEVTSLKVGVVYSFRIVARNAMGASLPSESSTCYLVPSSPFIIVTAPNGAESWGISTVHTITWNSHNGPGAYVRIELVKGSTAVLTMSSKARNNGAFSWTVPSNIMPGEYQVRIRSTTSMAGDISDTVFTIPTPTLTVTAPDGSAIWTAGQAQEITWTSTNMSTDVRLELISGTSTTVIAASTANDGSFIWSIPRTLAAGQYQIRVSSVANSAWKALGQPFMIVASPEPAITLTSPNGGQTWMAGTMHAITWVSQNDPGDTVRIELWIGGRKLMTLASSTANDGVFEWKLPSTLIPARIYQIKIVSCSDPTVSDMSDGFFSIIGASKAISVDVCRTMDAFTKEVA
jgi:hypothetical protein